MELIQQVVIESWSILQDSVIYIFIGFIVAGLLKAFLPDDLVNRHLGKNNYRSIFKASLLGIPLPLWSCGVIPAAAGLRQQGAGKGATTAFLISTPETGVDSIAISYALLDPFMTILRPVAAFITATVAGISVNALESDEKPTFPAAPTWTKSNCACGAGRSETPFFARIREGLRFAFVDLLGGIGGWLIVGIVVAGAISTFLPAEFIEEYLGSGMLSMLMTLGIAVPLYICATGSTPIAAALALKGLSPGAVMVFLLAGPATNSASLMVIAKILGKRTAIIYVGVIIVVSLAIGTFTNYFYISMGLDISQWVQGSAAESINWITTPLSIFLLSLIGFNFVRLRFFNGNEPAAPEGQRLIQ